ncbi:3-phosphoglycerate dehydrogenase [Candidatus Bathyarchaeota archaeon]|nr:3-phosphoglycerate dehydrogenase [Candidatus Bathyarchaeota archaeon]
MKILFIAGRWAQNIEESKNYKALAEKADVYLTSETDQDILAAKAEDVDIIITGAPVSAKIINRAKRLKMIQTTSVGYDSIDMDAAASNGVILCNVAEANANSVAELVFGLVLDVARRISAHDRLLRNGGWGRFHVERQVEIRGGTLGIIGLGAIGSRVAQIGKYAFNMRVLACDPYIIADRAEQFGGKLVDMETLLKESDVVTTHTPLNDETRHLIGERELKLMKPTAILINTSRGPVVDEKALIKALKQERISGAGLDVFETEPLEKDSPLRSLDNAVIIPHIGSTPGALRYMLEVASDNVLRVVEGKEPFRIKTPDTYYTSEKWKK